MLGRTAAARSSPPGEVGAASDKKRRGRPTGRAPSPPRCDAFAPLPGRWQCQRNPLWGIAASNRLPHVREIDRAEGMEGHWCRPRSGDIGAIPDRLCSIECRHSPGMLSIDRMDGDNPYHMRKATLATLRAEECSDFEHLQKVGSLARFRLQSTPDRSMIVNNPMDPRCQRSRAASWAVARSRRRHESRADRLLRCVVRQ